MISRLASLTDALYSPVKLVKYDVQNTRVGQMTDYDKLILEVNTDGRITPDDAPQAISGNPSSPFGCF